VVARNAIGATSVSSQCGPDKLSVLVCFVIFVVQSFFFFAASREISFRFATKKSAR
jgi:hypothetical protein